MGQLRPISGQIGYYIPLFVSYDVALTFLVVFLEKLASICVSNSHLFDQVLSYKVLSIVVLSKVLADETAR